MSKTKTITCDKCNGRGYFTYERYGADYAGVNVLRCEACRGIGAVVAPVTNADHIRSMTDEELMHWCNHTCPPNDKWKSCDGGDFDECENCWLNWLRQPYKEDA